MEIAGDTRLKFLDLKLKISEDKIRVDVYAKYSNSFNYITCNTYYPKNKICNISRGTAFRLRRIYDDDEIFKKISSEYQTYSIATDHEPSIVKKQFSEVEKI